MRFRLIHLLIAAVLSACNPLGNTGSTSSVSPGDLPIANGTAGTAGTPSTNVPAGNADPWGGGDFIRSLFEMSREQMVHALELIDGGYPIASLCASRCRVGQDPMMCAYLDLDPYQQTACQSFITTYAREIIRMNTGANRVPIEFDYDPARFRLGEREVIALTERASSGPVFFNFLAALPFVQFPISRIAILMHEMGHKVGNFAADPDPADFFDDTEHRNNTVGAAVAKFVDDHDSYAEAVVADGARGYWRLNGRVGLTAPDDSGNLWTAHYTLPPNRTFCNPLPTAGAIANDPNRAMRFFRCYVSPAQSPNLAEAQRRSEASLRARLPNDVVDALQRPVAQFRGTGLWVEFWMKWDGQGDPDFAGDTIPVAFYRRVLKLDRTSLRFTMGVNQQFGVGFTGHDFVGRWVHVAAYFGQELPDSRLFIDGEERELRTFGNIPAGAPSLTQALAENRTFQVSGHVGSDYLQFSGGIDEVALYTQELTPIQIREHYRLGIGQN